VSVVFVEPQSPETQHGAIIALGYMVGRYMSKKKSAASEDSTHGMEQQMSITSQGDDELVAMATKSIGMQFIFATISCISDCIYSLT